MRPAPLLIAALASALVAACGGGVDAPAPPPVQVAIASPSDEAVVNDRQVEVNGTVRPSTATVIVGGRKASVAAGTFRATVTLAPGTNVVDVLASAGRARPALTAIRIRRELSVRVPDLIGLPADDAEQVLRGVGLKADVQDADGFLGRLLPGKPEVCETRPRADQKVDPGTTVHILAARRC
jgi:Glucodextranase, domain B/PASTA domain